MVVVAVVVCRLTAEREGGAGVPHPAASAADHEVGGGGRLVRRGGKEGRLLPFRCWVPPNKTLLCRGLRDRSSAAAAAGHPWAGFLTVFLAACLPPCIRELDKRGLRLETKQVHDVARDAIIQVRTDGRAIHRYLSWQAGGVGRRRLSVEASHQTEEGTGDLALAGCSRVSWSDRGPLSLSQERMDEERRQVDRERRDAAVQFELDR